jgi:protein-L-isoaspartate(D-aspartate) O-methyltransferase
MLDFALARRWMVDGQLRTFDVNDIPLLAAFDEMPRERFVPPGRESLAYSDLDIPVGDADGEERHMLKPMVLARLIQALEIARGARVLDVACGRGYASAVMSRLGAAVIALESGRALADEARAALAAVGVPVEVVVGPLDHGYAAAAPYDAILVNGALDMRPERLLDQLKDGGRLACIRGRGRAAKAKRYVRSGDAFGSLALFDAAAPTLAAFKREPGFVF